MNMHPGDSLSPEEQALADRLRTVGGADGPSPALDARILAAARAAASPATARPRRWRAWSAMSGGLLTAVGTAAAFVLVVGTVWQLRPDERRLPAGEAASDDGFVSVLMIEPREAPAAEAATIERLEADRPDGDRVAPARRARSPAPAAAARTPRREPMDAPPAAVSPAPAPSAPAPQEAAAAMPETAAAPDVAAEPAGEPATEMRRPSAPRRASYTSSARAAPDVRTTRPAREDADVQPPASPRDYGPARMDAALPPADWLQRILDRRAQGDVEGAAESLRLFRQSHPRVRLPDVLREVE